MTKIIVFNIPTSGHIDPSLPLVAELVRRGAQATYYLTPGYRAAVEQTGSTFQETPGMTDDYFAEVSRRFNPFRLVTQLLVTAHDLLPQMKAMLMEEKPDVVIYDSMCPWGHLAAKLSGIPTVSSMALLDLPPSYVMKSGDYGTALKVLGRALPWMGRYQRAKRQLEKSYSLQIPGIYTTLNWPGELNIIYSAEQIHPDANALHGRIDARYLFVGPPMNQETSDESFPFEELDSARPLIYISLGTVFSNNPAFFRACIEAFRDQNYQVVMSLGRRLSIESLGEIPPNFIVRAYVPQLAVLERSDLYITHGGVNSTHQALYYGIPLLLVPQQLEQAAVAVRLVELGAGLRLRKPTAAKLRSMASRLLDDKAFRLQAEVLGTALKEAGGVTRAADEIEAFGSARAAEA